MALRIALVRCTEAARAAFQVVQKLSLVCGALLKKYIPGAVLRSLPALARLGLASRGVLYIVIAALAYEAGGRNGAAGAINLLGTGVGLWLVLLLLFGFTGYGGWRFFDALLGLDNPGSSPKALFRRVGSLGSAGIHLVLAHQCYEFLADPREWTGQLTNAASTILELPLLGLVLLLASAAVAAAGAAQLLINGAKGSFVTHLDPACRYTWLRWIGHVGYSARGLALLWLAHILLLSALDPKHARIGGVGLALVTLSGPLAKILSVGLSTFGVYCLAEAWFRRIVPVPRSPV